MNRRRVVSGAALAVAGLGLAMALVLVITDGFEFTISGTTVTAHEPLRPLALSAVGLAVFALAYGVERTERLWVGAVGRLSNRTLAATLAGAITAVGIVYNTTVASGSDEYGYVSQADLWIDGNLHVPQPWAEHVPWPSKRWSFAPLGYRPVEADGRWEIVPTYSPGLPLLMAGAKLVAGQEAMFLVVPIFGGLLVFATWGIGDRLGASRAGLVAAWLVATSPAFLFHLVVPMSDVATAGAWAVAVFLLLRGGGVGASATAGVMAGLGLMIRPNLVLVAVVVGLYAMFRRIPDGVGLRHRLAHGIAFGTPVLLALIATSAIYQSLYGSPFVSGYGRSSDLFAWANVRPNIRNYLVWFIDTQTMAGVVGLAAVFVPLRRLWPGVRDRRVLVMIAGLVLVTWAQYMPYLVFDNMRYLRFLLPTWPFVMLGVGAVALAVIRLGRPALTLAVIGVVLGLGIVGWRHAAREGAFDMWESERRFAAAGILVRDVTPPNSAVLAMLHSGSLRYYGGRMTIRYDFLDRDWLDRGVSWLNDRGVRVYALLEEWEVERFTSRFAGERLTARLESPPLAVHGDGRIRLYDLSTPALGSSPTAAPVSVMEGALGRLRSQPPAPAALLTFAP